MTYEWDSAKARRGHLVKFAVVWLVALTLASVPLWLLMQAADL